jgi:hypothetical protein
MTSRMVTVDLILEVSLGLRDWELLPFTEEESRLYESVKMILNGWAKQIEEQGLAVRLETIARNAVEIFRNSEGDNSWVRLSSFGDQLLERAREIEELILNRSSELGQIPRQEEITKALKEGNPVEFRDAALDITGLKNSGEARTRLEELLTLLRDWDTHAGSEAWNLINDVVNKKRELTTSSVALVKNCFPRLDVLRDAEKCKKK